jgi:hypothetical protein
MPKKQYTKDDGARMWRKHMWWTLPVIVVGGTFLVKAIESRMSGLGRLPDGYRSTKYPAAKQQAHRWMSQVKSYQGNEPSVSEVIDDNSSMETGRLRDFQKVMWGKSSPKAAEFVSSNGIGRPE